MSKYPNELQWNPASEPPEAVGGCWSKPVIVVTNYETACLTSYFKGADGGCWQTPSFFEPGERIVKWTEVPDVEISE